MLYILKVFMSWYNHQYSVLHHHWFKITITVGSTRTCTKFTTSGGMCEGVILGVTYVTAMCFIAEVDSRPTNFCWADFAGWEASQANLSQSCHLVCFFLFFALNFLRSQLIRQFRLKFQICSFNIFRLVKLNENVFFKKKNKNELKFPFLTYGI